MTLACEKPQVFGVKTQTLGRHEEPMAAVIVSEDKSVFLYDSDEAALLRHGNKKQF
jgi:hypothetical protein